MGNHSAKSVHVALLRGVNVGGHRRLPMSALRALAEDLGWERVGTYVQSGNLVFAAGGTCVALEHALEAAIERHFEFAVSVAVRTGAQWLTYAAASPYPAAESARATMLQLGLAKHAPKAGTAEQLARYCTLGEAVSVRDEVLWIDYAGGVGRSKLTPAVLERALGSPVTLRNWKTVQELAARVRAGGA